jgi:hypothetical protein
MLHRRNNALAPPHPRAHIQRNMLRQYELVEKVLEYDPQADQAMLNRAYVYTVQKHGSQKRASGDPYFSHPVEVAGLMTDLKLDHPCAMHLGRGRGAGSPAHISPPSRRAAIWRSPSRASSEQVQ